MKLFFKLVPFVPKIADFVESLDQKAWYLSKTVWVQGIILVGSIATVLSGNDIYKPTSEEAIAIGAAIPAAIAIILRIITKKPIGL